jgi:hypothetical protein
MHPLDHFKCPYISSFQSLTWSYKLKSPPIIQHWTDFLVCRHASLLLFSTQI